jgi:glutathione synthase/RimK-type ligase-like ATP-grasp enzyme
VTDIFTRRLDREFYGRVNSLRLWIVMPSDPITDDRAYVAGYLKHVFEDVMVSRVSRDAAALTPPPRQPHAVLNMMSTRNKALLESIESHASEAGAALSSPTWAAWNADDKRTYVEHFADVSPPTRIARTLEDVHAAFVEFGGDIVVKDPFGFRGQGVERISSESDLSIAEQVAANAVGPTRELVVQPFMSGFATGDKRIITQKAPDGRIEIIAYIMRRPPPGNWKCNIRSGGVVEQTELTDAERAIALEVGARSGLDNTAMDIAEHEGRLYYIEHNNAAGGIIDYDLGRDERGVEKIGAFLRHIAEHGRSADMPAHVSPSVHAAVTQPA